MSMSDYQASVLSRYARRQATRALQRGDLLNHYHWLSRSRWYEAKRGPLTCVRCNERMDPAARCAGSVECSACAWERGEMGMDDTLPDRAA